ncbi:MAG TPA: hypothetical protein VKU94_02400 [Geobacterales bacterium]|nr:hypothetical protein [Geobacterales bacterium]
MAAVSSALGSFFLVILISFSTFFYIYVAARTFDSLTIYMNKLEKLEEKDSERITLLASFIDRLFPSFIKSSSSNSSGSIYDILSGNPFISYSNSGNLSITFVFLHIPSGSLWSLNLEYYTFSINRLNATFMISLHGNENSTIYNASIVVSNVSSIESLSIIFDGNLISNSAEIEIALNTGIKDFLGLGIKQISLKSLDSTSHFAFFVLYNAGNYESKILSLILFNDRSFQFYSINASIQPLSMSWIILVTNVTYGYAKLITERGNVFYHL